MTAIVVLVVWLAAAFPPEGEPRYGVFKEEETCKKAVAEARAAGIFATDCARVELSKPKNGISS